MRKLMLKVLLMFTILGVNTVYSQIPDNCIRPETYAQKQRSAPERLSVEIQNVSVKRESSRFQIRGESQVFSWDEVQIAGRIVAVQHSKSGLRKGKNIKISYTTNYNPPSGANIYDPRANYEWYDAPIAPLEVGKIYPAFLRKENGRLYKPVAYSRSFIDAKSADVKMLNEAVKCAESIITNLERRAETRIAADIPAEEFARLLGLKKIIIFSTPDNVSETLNGRSYVKFREYGLVENLIYVLLDVSHSGKDKPTAVLFNVWEAQSVEIPVAEVKELFKYVTVEGADAK